MAINSIQADKLFNTLRNSEAFQRVDEEGNVVFVPNDTPREYFSNGKRMGVLLERNKRNFLPDSINPKPQSVFLSAGEYVFHAIGQGDASILFDSNTITYTGTPVPFSLASDTTVYVYPEPSLRAFQIEEGPTPTSIVRTPENSSGERAEESLAHGRGDFFSRNTGTFIGQFNLTEVEDQAVYFQVDSDTTTFKIIGDGQSFVFNVDGEIIQFLNPIQSDGSVNFAIIYNSTQGFVRCYLNEEVGELSIPFVKPTQASFSRSPHPTQMFVSRYEYRPKALTNGEVSKKFDYQFELAYDFEVSPSEVSDWADRIFASAVFGL